MMKWSNGAGEKRARELMWRESHYKCRHHALGAAGGGGSGELAQPAPSLLRSTAQPTSLPLSGAAHAQAVAACCCCSFLPFLAFQSLTAALMASSASMLQCSLTGGRLRCLAMSLFLMVSTSSTALPLTLQGGWGGAGERRWVDAGRAGRQGDGHAGAGLAGGSESRRGRIASAGRHAGAARLPTHHSVATLLLAMAEPQPKVLKQESTMLPASSTLICSFMTSPQAGAPTRPVPTLGSPLSKLPTLRGFS